ncbi:caspase family protein [Streptomyces phaeochromogenes]|uniref:caspase family protein n=1 Tax=Streptomyces phaeochromogenes TaxID=1923 RepID=UPI002DD80A01|nr:caspase family protein [Streptomyces phaeochromogenes]WRZ26269.1 caspase family protein [Streptomyces phaeochromogenes]
MFYEATRHSGPGVHALIIGVGYYPYLAGNVQSGTAEWPAFSFMPQLTSPPRSARAFAQWLSDNADERNWTVPLASVDLLLSFAPKQAPDLAAVIHGEATIDAIRQRFEAWLARCAQDPDNVAVFYFCGHGVQGDGQFLLASDFNKYAATPFAHAFDFDETRLALQQRGPRTQWMIIDACRVDCARRPPSGVQPLADPELFAISVCQNEVTLRMPMSDQAGARVGEVSFLTQALIRALDGQAATTDEHGEWVVRMDGVRRSIDTLLGEELGFQPLSRGVESINLGDAVLYRLGEAPLARLIVRCLPSEATARTTVSYTSHDMAAQPTAVIGMRPAQPLPAKGAHGQEWRIDLRAGVYTVRAECDRRSVSRTQCVLPPQSVMSLRVIDA